MRVTIISTLTLITIAVLTFCNKTDSTDYYDIYYYSQDKKVYLTKEKHKFILGVKRGFNSSFQPELLNKYNLQVKSIGCLPEGKYYVRTIRNKQHTDTRELLQKIRSEKYVDFIYPLLKPINKDNSLLMPTNEVLYAPKLEVSGKEIRHILAEIEPQVETDNYYGDFVLRIKKQSPRDVIEIANYLYESGAMDYAYPNFIATLE